ncbi:MAG: hypothetical protein R6V62_09840 [Candidatus Fermentibacteraceae bacterium]
MGTSLRKGELATALAGIAVWLSIVLFRGFSLEWVALPLAAVAVSTLTGGPMFIPGLMVLMCATASLTGAALAAVAGVLSAFSSRRISGRTAGWLAVSAWVLANPSTQSAPMVAACAIASLFDGRKARVVIAAVSAVLLLYLGYLPARAAPEPARCFLEEGHAWWKLSPITLGTGGAVLAPPVPGPFTMTLELQCGGVRDSLPVITVLAGDKTVCLPSGSHTLRLDLAPSDSVFILPVREPRPFTHPVAHVWAEATW